MYILTIAIIELILAAAPYFYFNKHIKKLSKSSLIVVVLLLIPPLIYTPEAFPVENKLLLEFISFSNSLSLATIALLPLAFKSTVLLWRHEIRLFEYNRNILLFLTVSLIETFIQVTQIVIRLVKLIIFSS